MRSKITTAVFPIAGLGTRFLPATKSIPKEILTLVDRPLIQYAMDEARESGIKDFIFVTARGKSALEDYFDVNPNLEQTLRRSGKTELLDILKATNIDSGHVAYVRQNQAQGLGHAVWCARRLIGRKSFAVILPDDLVVSDTPCLAQMMEAHAEYGGNVVATMEVSDAETSSYGVLDVIETIGKVLRPRGIVEKPKPGTAPSNQAVVGRYILSANVMKHLNDKTPGAGGEIQLTDAIAKEMEINPGSVVGLRFEGKRYDCGSKSGMLKATVALAMARDDLRDEFGEFLRAMVGQSGAGPVRVPLQIPAE